MVFASVVLATIATIALVRSSSSMQKSATSRRLEGEIKGIVEHYRRIQDTYLRKDAGSPLAAKDEAALRALMHESLSDDPGMEGGFFDSAEGRLLGFAFPTFHGRAPTEPAAAVKQAAEHVSRLAVARRSGARLVVDSGADVLLFRARALTSGNEVEGAAWIMKAVPGIRALRGKLYRLLFLVLLGLSVATTALSWRFTHRLDRAVRTIEETLWAKESRPDYPVPKTRVEEIDRIGAGIDHLARSLEEHRRLQGELEDRLHRADRLATLGKLVAGVAHEVRNPLASIKLKLHLLRRNWAGTGGSEAAFSVIHEEIGRLDRMVARLLTISRAAKTDGSGLQDLAQLVESRADFWSARAAERDIRLEVEIGPDTRGAAAVDADTVVPILDNLLSNAIEAIDHAGGAIAVTLERPAVSEMALAVTDTGPGVEPSAVERLFEPFFTTREGGTGLGLFLSAEMARRLGGEIRHSPVAEGGARFELRMRC
jgi:signal transduction histidine kinase